jgi:LysM repeat protein
MKDWATLEPDVVKIVPANRYTAGRTKPVSFIVVHHNAGNLTVEQCYNVWLSREASAHYQVESGGRIGQLVWDRDTAWHSGSGNTGSIGIEHANNTFDPTWTISDACLENGAHLVAAICVYYKLGKPEWGKNVRPHSDFSATACPGAIKGNQRAKYMERAVYWYNQMTATPDPPKPEPPKPEPEAVTYTVKKGDTLTSIAKAYGTTVKAIHEANLAVIGPDPNKIEIGMVLTIPGATLTPEPPKPPDPEPEPEPEPEPTFTMAQIEEAWKAFLDTLTTI